MMDEKDAISNSLYDLAMRLTDIGAKKVDQLIESLCKQAGIDYPPKQTGVTQ